jgi:hypothetical protein
MRLSHELSHNEKPRIGSQFQTYSSDDVREILVFQCATIILDSTNVQHLSL